MDEKILNEIIAMQTVLVHVVRSLRRDQAIEEDVTPEEIAEEADVMKQHLEVRVGRGQAESYLTAAVERFFGPLISDLKKIGEAPLKPEDQ